jgi:hypothetical protein
MMALIEGSLKSGSNNTPSVPLTGRGVLTAFLTAIFVLTDIFVVMIRRLVDFVEVGNCEKIEVAAFG